MLTVNQPASQPTNQSASQRASQPTGRPRGLVAAMAAKATDDSTFVHLRSNFAIPGVSNVKPQFQLSTNNAAKNVNGRARVHAVLLVVGFRESCIEPSAARSKVEANLCLLEMLNGGLVGRDFEALVSDDHVNVLEKVIIWVSPPSLAYIHSLSIMHRLPLRAFTGLARLDIVSCLS